MPGDGVAVEYAARVNDAETRLADQQRVWEDWARADPLWAIASVPELKGGRWEQDEFFATGVVDVEGLVAQVAGHGLTLRTGRCLDFGCGVGRLTQALAGVFEQADGVDVSATMIEQANRYNTLGDRLRFHVNVSGDLSLFEDDSFDLVFTTMVLQHIQPVDAVAYIREFVRVVRPGGVVVFDLPARLVERPMPEGGHRATLRFGSLPTFVAGEETPVRVEVTNASRVPWPGSMTFRVGNSWRGTDGRVVQRDDARAALLDPVAPGETVTVELAVTPPAAGELVLAADVVEEGVAWFADRGSSPVTATVQVGGGDAPAEPRRRFGRRRRDAAPVPAGAPAGDASPVLFSMNAVPVAEVTAAVEQAGGHVVAHDPVSSAGPEWETYRYFAVVD